MRLDPLGNNGAGVQIHVEDLAVPIAGRERGDGEARWDELVPPYRPGGQRPLGHWPPKQGGARFPQSHRLRRHRLQ